MSIYETNETKAAMVWPVRPVQWGKTQSNEWTARVARVMNKWVVFAETSYAEWPDRPNCGHFFEGTYWYELESAHTAAIYAVLAVFDEPESPTAFSKKHLSERAISAIRYMGFTHDSGPEECVRAHGRNVLNSGVKWGGRNDTYFMATQTGGSLAYIGFAAWLLWDQMDDETKMLVQNMLVYFADRWAEVEPRNGTYFDTQCEENGWTAIALFTIALLFPEHPHQAKWWEAYHKWNINSLTSFRDRISKQPVRGVPLRERVTAITMHPDYTLENHAFVHPTYMAASHYFRGREISALMLAGLPLATIDLIHDKEIYEKTLKLWSDIDGIAASVQGQDWWYNQQFSFMYSHALMNLLHDDQEAACLQDKGMSIIEAVQNSNTRGCLLEQDGEFCHVVKKDFQTVIDMEHLSAIHLMNTYLLHKTMGNGVEPLPAEQVEHNLAGIHHYPFGGFITHRTPKTFNTFSWRNNVMAMNLGTRGAWLQTPLYESYTGIVKVSEGGGDRVPENEMAVYDNKTYHLNIKDDGFAAYAVLERSTVHLLQHIGFVSLPDGRSVYFEQFHALQAVTVALMETGTIGVRNEYYSELPDLAKGHRTLYLPGHTQRFESWKKDGEDVTGDYPACAFANIDNEAGYLIYGSQGIRYFNQQQFDKWKGGEDRLILNQRTAPLELQAGQSTPLFTIVGLPNATLAETEIISSRSLLFHGTGSEPHAVVWTDGQYLAYFNAGSAVEAIACYAPISLSSHEKKIPLFQGFNKVDEQHYMWTAALQPGQSGFHSCEGTLELGADQAAALDIQVSEAGIIFMNTANQHIAFQFRWQASDASASALPIKIQAGGYHRLHK